ncbi:MAG: hypothetical protein IKC70_01705 [Bacteroidaceae bacterium]|nr:hypothetical protein [Bacteroidaceae bacterium]
MMRIITTFAIGIYAVEIMPFPPSYGNRRKMCSSAAIIRSYRVAEVKNCPFSGVGFIFYGYVPF